MNTRTWAHPITGEKETVEVDSARDKELVQKLNDSGWYTENDPNKPEGCIVPTDEWWEQQREIMRNRLGIVDTVWHTDEQGNIYHIPIKEEGNVQ